MNQKILDLKVLEDCKDLKELIKKLSSYLIEKHEIDGLEFFLLDESESRLICEYISLPDKLKSLEKTLLRKEISINTDDITTASLRELAPCIIDMNYDKRFSSSYLSRNKMLRSYASIPLINNNRAYGCLVIYEHKYNNNDNNKRYT